jgi:O-antigen ligase
MTHFFQGSSVLFLVILLLLKTKKDIWYVLVAYLGGTLFLAFRTVESFLQHPLERAVGYVGQNPAHIGFNMYLGLFTCLILASKVKPMHYKLLFYLAFFFQVFAGFTTQTRTFMLAISFALLIFIVLKKQWGAFIVLLVSIPIILHFLPNVFYERIQEGFSGADKGAGRLLIWQIGESIIKQNFIFGVGFDNFRAVFSHYFKSANVWYSREDMGAHNVYMMMLAELGFGGFLLFLYLFFYRLLLPLVKKIKTEIGLTHILLLTLMCFLIEFSFIDMLIERQTWVVVGLIFVLLNLDKQSKGMESET